MSVAAVLALIFNWQTLFGMVFGLIVGIFFGAIPGLTGVMAIAIFLPFTFSMEPAAALITLFSCFNGGCFGGSITAILIGTPGASSAAATMLDGYPMALKGQGEKALSTALIASCIGGFVSAIMLLFFAPVVAKWTLNFAPPEYFVLGIFGISVIAGLNEGNMIMGIVSGLIGIFISLIGMDTMSGSMRFTFGSLNLYSGFGITPIILGLFALIRIFGGFVRKKGAEETKKVVLEHSKMTAEDKKNCVMPIVRGSLIGSIIGIIPAAGADIAAFIAYNMEKAFGKRRTLIGTGIVEGIAAPESANNAVTASSLIPLLTLGIPGSGGAATLLGAFNMHGLAPGPYLFQENGTVMYAIMIGFLLTNVFMFLIVKMSMRMWVQVTRVPEDALVSTLFVICLVGAFCGNASYFDVKVMVIVGVAAWFMTQLNIPVIPFILGFVLGPTIETNFRKALVMSSGNPSIFLTRPICIGLLVLTVVLLVATRKMTRTMASGEEEV